MNSVYGLDRVNHWGDIDKHTSFESISNLASKEYIQEDIIAEVASILKKNQFILNEKKAYFMNKKCRRFIIGVVIDNNNSLSVGSKKYREIKRLIYGFLVEDEGDKDKILGYLSYIRVIDIERYNSIKITYSKDDTNNILF